MATYSKTNWLRARLQNHVLGLAAWTMPTLVELGLYTVAPTASTPGTEVTGSGYGRKLLTASNLTTALAGEPNVNSAAFTFTASADWGFIRAWGVLVGGSPPDLALFCIPDDIVEVLSGDTYTIPVGRLRYDEV
ncbi:MAG: hypothetical protein AB7F67_03810 [Rhodospirillaceae bacterium]